MPFTAEDCKRLTGTDQPDYYTTPTDWSRCKNLRFDGPTPCWHPHCDCMADLPKVSVFSALKRLLGFK